MALTKRSVKGSALTFAEMDANWDAAVGGATRSIINEVEFGNTTIAGKDGETYYFKIWGGTGGGGGARVNQSGHGGANVTSRAVAEITLVGDNDITYVQSVGGTGGGAGAGSNGGDGTPASDATISIGGEIVVSCGSANGGQGRRADSSSITIVVGMAVVNTNANWTIKRQVTENSNISNGYGSIQWEYVQNNVEAGYYGPYRVAIGALGGSGTEHGNTAGDVGRPGRGGYIGIHKI